MEKGLAVGEGVSRSTERNYEVEKRRWLLRGVVGGGWSGDYAAFESRISRMGGCAGGGEDKAEAAAARRASARRVECLQRGCKDTTARGGRGCEPRLLPRRGGKAVVVDVCESKPRAGEGREYFTQAVLHVHDAGRPLTPTASREPVARELLSLDRATVCLRRVCRNRVIGFWLA